MRFLSLLLSLLLTGFLFLPGPSLALIEMDLEAINYALTYGLKLQGKGYQRLLGPNWKESDGVLLNIYSPFMMLASKAYKSNLPRGADKETLRDLKKYNRREIRHLKDKNDPKMVKFSTSLYGNNDAFPRRWNARIEGFGRGRHYQLEPKRQLRPKTANKSDFGGSDPYEAVNAYYFSFNELKKLEGDYELVLMGPNQKRVRFKLNNEEIY